MSSRHGRRGPAMKPAAAERLGPGRRWISVREAARYIGVHEMTIRDWLSAGKLRGGRIGRCVRIDARDLDRRLEESAAKGQP
jgi:excisionase family DNA binding protein